MNAPADPTPALPRGTLLWTLAAAVLVHAALRRFVPTGGLELAALVGLLLGALPALPGYRERGWLSPVPAVVYGGLPTAAASVAAMLALDPLVALGGSATLIHGAAFLVLGVAALAALGSTRRLGVLIGVEWLKLRRGRLVKGGLGVAMLATLLAGVTHKPLAGESGWAVAAGSLGVGFWTAEILLLVLGATAVAGEIGQGTMKMILPHAYRRSEWVAAKGIVLMLAALLFLVGVALTGIVHAAATVGLDDVVKLVPSGFGEEDELRVFQTADVMRSHLTDALLATGVSLATSALLGLLLSCLFDSLVPALSASFLLFVVIKVGDTFLGFEESVLRGIYAQYPDELMQRTVRLGRGLNEGWNAALLPDGFHLGLLTGVLGFLVAVRLFARRDLHG